MKLQDMFKRQPSTDVAISRTQEAMEAVLAEDIDKAFEGDIIELDARRPRPPKMKNEEKFESTGSVLQDNFIIVGRQRDRMLADKEANDKQIERLTQISKEQGIAIHAFELALASMGQHIPKPTKEQEKVEEHVKQATNNGILETPGTSAETDSA